MKALVQVYKISKKGKLKMKWRKRKVSKEVHCK